VSGVRVTGPEVAGSDRVLTPDALEFVATLVREFDPRRRELLARRVARQAALDRGEFPVLLTETRAMREGSWTVAPAPEGLRDRRVEITGPTDAKMMINALNSGALVFMADFEDATSPTWANLIGGQANCIDAVRRQLEHTAADGRRYSLNSTIATLVVRPRGWHLPERHLEIDGVPVPGGIVDLGLYLFHNAAELLVRGGGPWCYLPKLESHLEARLWNDLFVRAQSLLGIPHGSIRATVLIETILAAFEMDEILYELRDHASGLNAGRWDYLFSVIKTFREHPAFVLPDRAQLTMAVPFMRAYSERLVVTCHRRGAHAIGGMAAFIPSRHDPEVNARALEKVKEDKGREAAAGFDGAWVAHPDLVPVVAEVFSQAFGDAVDQKKRRAADLFPDPAALIEVKVPGSAVTWAGVSANIRIALLYLDAWLGGTGAVGIDNLMEDAATAEIARAQLWQWRRHGAVTADGVAVTLEALHAEIDDGAARLEPENRGRLHEARILLRDLVGRPQLTEFFTLPAYEVLEGR
jgi:malate synthase